MTEHSEQTPAASGEIPARIQLDDLIEAVTRGVTRALAAQDEVSGYALRTVDAQPGGSGRAIIAIITGIFPPVFLGPPLSVVPPVPPMPPPPGPRGLIVQLGY